VFFFLHLFPSFQVFIILVLVRSLAKLLRRMHQPVVIGEIIAGVLLGPSCFGQIPGFSSTLFPPTSLPFLKLVASIALIFFMFFLGMELEVDMMAQTWRTTAPTTVLAFLVSFFLGVAAAPLLSLVDSSLESGSASTTLRLFVGMAFAFSAFPVLARVLANHRLLSTTLGIQAISCAAIDDIVAWVTLALALSYAKEGNIVVGLYTSIVFIGFVVMVFVLIKPLLASVHKYLLERNDELNQSFMSVDGSQGARFLYWMGSALWV
jgi:Kef-type K+ transport system membrane component KefB